MGRIANGWELSKQSWNALRANPQLLVFPLMSLAGMVAVTIVFLIPMAGAGIFDAVARSAETGESQFTSGQMTLSAIVGFVYSFVGYTVVIFSNVALVGAAMKLARGETATVQDGINIARARLGKILAYAFISAVVGTIARAISQSGRDNGIAGQILAAVIGGIIQGAWSLVVFFAIPVLVVEDVGVIDSMKRSLSLFKQTWGESFVGQTAIGLIGCVATIALMAVGGLLIFGAVSTGSTLLVVLAVVLVVLMLVGVGLLNGAVNGVFQASLYHYATTGNAGKLIDTQLAAQAFRM
jgi:uncharacterized membrane protein YeaQ/YmgE (transglycosylase-associated protein family)